MEYKRPQIFGSENKWSAVSILQQVIIFFMPRTLKEIYVRPQTPISYDFVPGTPI